MFSSRFFKLLILSSLLPLLLFSATWTHTQVATAPISTRPVIAADSLGHLHIAWTADDPYGETLQYATNQSGAWAQRQIAGSGNNSAYNPSLTTDKYGFAYLVARFYSSNFNIRYFTNAYQTNNYWNSLMALGYGHYHECSIEVDGDNNTHVFAQEDTWGSNVFYQSHDLDHVVIDGGTSQFFSTAIDHHDVLHFVGSHADNVWYTSNDGSGWTTADSIDQLEISTGQPSIACDRQGYLHVAFTSSNGIYYTNNITGSWSTPEQTTGSGLFPNIAIDENGNAHIVFYTQVEWGGLMYINNISGSWSAAEDIATINTDISSATEDVAHVESKLALGLKDNTINIVYIKNNNQVMLAQTDDYQLRKDDTDTTATLTSLDDPPKLDTLSAATQGTLNLLHFSISDHSGDGLPLILKEMIFQSGPAMSDELAFNDIFSELTLDCSDGSSTACTIYAQKILAGTPDAGWKSINESGSLDFTLKGTLRSGLTNVDNKAIQVKINGLYDILTDNSGTQFSLSSQDVVSDTMMFHIVPDHFEFLYLGNDLYNENLVIGWSMLVRLVDINGNVATGVTGMDLSLSAVELDGVTPTSPPLQSTQSLTKTMTSGVASWSNITFPETGRIRILASCDLLSSPSDTITVMPYASTLLISPNDSISKVLDDLGIDHDYYHEDNYQFPTVSKITEYDNLLLFPSLEYSWYIDSTKIKYFLDAGSDSSRKNILAFGENALGYFKDSPFAGKYFGATLGNTFYQNGSGLTGETNDPITNGINLALHAGNIAEIDPGQATAILSENSSGKIVGCRVDDPVYRTVLITPAFSSLIPDGSPDSLLTRVISWFNTYETTNQPPVLSDIPDILMKEDNVLQMPLSDWNSYVNDPDTPLDQLHWVVGSSVHVTVSLLDDTLMFIPQANYFGTDSMIVTVSDGEFEDRDTVRILIEAVNDTPYVFDQLWPLDGSTIADTSSLIFSWQPSVDVDGDILDYDIHFYAPGFDTIIVLTDSVILPIDDLMIFPADTLIYWSVSALDQDGASVTASNAPLSLTIERTEVSIDNIMPVSFEFPPNYPNPFNPSTTIRFGLPASEHVHIIVYNTRGRKVTDLLNEDMDAGYHELNWKAGSLASGIYIIRIHAGSDMGIRKVLLLK